VNAMARKRKFPISRDPPEGGTGCLNLTLKDDYTFPISRDPPEGGTGTVKNGHLVVSTAVSNF